MTIALTALISLGFNLRADARPEFARKEGVACQYCHVYGGPGTIDALTNKRQSTERNPRGIYYGTHNHSFKGYVETGLPKSGWPSFRYMWKEEFKTLPRRMAVADVTGDGKPRLILLNEKAEDKNSSTLEIRRWDGKQFVTEFTADVAAQPDRLAVGKLGGANSPAVILTTSGFWTWNGTTFTHQPSSTAIPIIGVTQMPDGSARALVAPTSKNILAYKVNVTSVKQGDWLVDPIPAPTVPAYSWADMHSSPEFLQSMGFPSSIGSGGVIGIWHLKAYKAYFLYQMDRGMDVAADPKNPGSPKITFNNTYHVVLQETRTGGTVWTSPRLPGEGYDIINADPKGGEKQGLLVLFNGTTPVNGVAGKGRTLAFFAME